MTANASEPALLLPLALREILAELHDAPFRERLERVFVAAALVIRRLRAFDLVRYDSESADAGPNLRLFEEIAPLLASAVADIQDVVRVVNQSFPPDARPTPADPLERDRAVRSVEILRERSQALRGDVLRLGGRLRTPQAVANHWNLLGDLQSASGQLRGDLGEMIVDVANVFAEVPKARALPEYEFDEARAILLRKALAKMAVALRGHLGRILAATDEQLPGLIARLSELFNGFARTQLWYELRAPDKREFVRFREQLAPAVAEGLGPEGARRLVEGFVRFLELLGATMGQREILRDHDRACLAQLTTLLERAEDLRFASPDRSRAMVAEMAKLCEGLAGRDEELDRFLGTLRGSTEVDSVESLAAMRGHTLRLLGSQ